MKKKILSVVLTLCMLLSLFPFAFSASADEATEIGTAEAFAALMNGTSPLSGDYILTADIDLSGVSQTPIGSEASPFTGTLDGDGHTISGINLTSGTANVGLFGYTDGATIQNLTVSGTVNVPAATTVGGLIGTATGMMTLKNIVNNINVTAKGRVGGIIGHATMASSDTTAGAFTMENIVNNGTITAGATGMVGGMIGRMELSGPNLDVTLSKLKNAGTVTGTGASGGSYVGGIAGLWSTKSPITVDSCLNTGAITGTYKYVGGFAGYFRCYVNSNTTVQNCMNTGAIHTNATAAGGLFGAGNGANYIYTVDSIYNTGSITGPKASPASGEYINPIAGSYAAKAVVSNTYYSSTDNYSSSQGTFISDPTVKTAFVGFDFDSKWSMGLTGPELTAFHTHNTAKPVAVDNDVHRLDCTCGEAGVVEAHNFVDDVCTVCGYEKTDCAHDGATHDQITLAPTCVATGLKDVICDKCGNTIATDVEVAIDPSNHVGNLVLGFNRNEAEEIDYYCDACGETVVEDYSYATDIYVSATGYAISFENVSEDTLLGSEDYPFLNMSDALEYAALAAEHNKDGVTVHIVDNAATGSNYQTPACDYMITITGGTYTLGNRFILSGPVTFENITLHTSAAIVYAARCHKFVIGQGVVTDAASMLVGGFEQNVGGAVPESGYTTDLTVRSGTWGSIFAGNRYATAARVTGAKTSGSTKLVIGKTDAADTLSISGSIVGLSGGDSTAPELLTDANILIDLDGDFSGTPTLYPTGSLTAAGTYVSNVLYRSTGTLAKTSTINKTVTTLTVYPDLSVDGTGDKADAIVATYGGEVGLICTYLDTEHVDVNEDNLCDKCGKVLGCEHTETETVILTAPTCKTTGLANVVCTICGDVLEEGKVLPLDPNNHDAVGSTWGFDSENEEYVLTCGGCGAEIARQADLPTVYVQNYVTPLGSDANIGTLDAPVLTLEEAVSRLAATGGTVAFNGRFMMSDSITLPAWAGTINFVGATNDAGGNATSGFYLEKNAAVLSLGGAANFDNIVFKGNSSTADTSIFIVANWNDLNMGYVRVHDRAITRLIAGYYNITADDLEEKTSSVTINGAAMSTGAGDYFYSIIYLGDVFGANGLRAANKTVTFTANDGTVGNTTHATTSDIDVLYTMSTSGTSGRDNCPVDNCTTIVNFNGNTTIARGRSGDRNVGYDDSTGKIDNLTLNFNDNSQIGTNYQIKNAKNLTINVSSLEDGRTTLLTKPIQMMAFGDFTATDATATANYTSHSFADSVAKPFVIDANHSGKIALNENYTDVCVWDEGEITTAPTAETDGVRTYTCTVCGKTMTETVPFDCVNHAFVIKADGTIECSICKDTFTAEDIANDVVVSVAPQTVALGTEEITVEVSLEAATAFAGAEFAVNAPAGFTLTGMTTTLGTLDGTEGLSLTGASTYALPYNMAVIRYPVVDATLAKTVVATLTFAVDESVEEGNYVITLTAT
ncbi:MAG: hypothetical protein IJU41_04060, partial [Clostridia bacterium]|nr:hypothetical protein [Clostridia bacterium]